MCIRDRFFGRNEHEVDILIAAKGSNQRMHGSAKLQIAAKADGKAAELSFLSANGQQIRQRLRRVVVAAIARVDNRNRRFH